jgi:predicted ATPase
MSAPKRWPLKRITLAGYKSIRKLDAFPLNSGLNVLIGANGSGKTNFIRFFELLGNIMDPNKGLQNYVSARGGADVFLFRGMKVTPEFHADLIFGSNEYRFTLKAADDRSLFFAEERTSYRTAGIDRGTGHKETKLVKKGWSIDTWPVDTEFIRGILNWRVYHFHDTSPNAKVMDKCNIVDCDVLHSDASNLAAFLMRMAQAHPAHYARIEETVRQVAPFFGAFVLKEVAPGQTQLLWKDRYSDLLYYPHQLSDGTLRYICLAALLLQPNPPATIIIDEPELGLHPCAIKLLASLLHEAAGRAQLIVSTQASLLVDELTPEEVIVVNHRDGETLFERLDPARLADWLKEYTLGQLWEKNELGGLP